MMARSGAHLDGDYGCRGGAAYSMIEVKEVDEFKLVCLRNPWGSFEWKVN